MSLELERMEKELKTKILLDEKEEKTYCVYIHISPEGKKYIGMTKGLNNRWDGKEHEYKHNKEFAEDLEKYGWDNFKHEILAETHFRWIARKLEKDLTLKYKDDCYNLTNFSKKPKRNTKNPKTSQN